MASQLRRSRYAFRTFALLWDVPHRTSSWRSPVENGHCTSSASECSHQVFTVSAEVREFHQADQTPCPKRIVRTVALDTVAEGIFSYSYCGLYEKTTARASHQK